MRLVYYCKFCSNTIKIDKTAPDRIKLDKILDAKLRVIRCDHCNKSQIIDLNKVYAKQGLLSIILFVVMIIVSIVITNYLFSVEKNSESYELSFLSLSGMIIPTLFYFAWMSEEKNKITYFNRIKI